MGLLGKNLIAFYRGMALTEEELNAVMIDGIQSSYLIKFGWKNLQEVAQKLASQENRNIILDMKKYGFRQMPFVAALGADKVNGTSKDVTPKNLPVGIDEDTYWRTLHPSRFIGVHFAHEAYVPFRFAETERPRYIYIFVILLKPSEVHKYTSDTRDVPANINAKLAMQTDNYYATWLDPIVKPQDIDYILRIDTDDSRHDFQNLIKKVENMKFEKRKGPLVITPI